MNRDTSMAWVGATTLLLLMVTIFASMNFGFSWVFYLTVTGQIFLVIMVLKVLQSPYSTDKTFDDFYEDRPMGRETNALFRKDQ